MNLQILRIAVLLLSSLPVSAGLIYNNLEFVYTDIHLQTQIVKGNPDVMLGPIDDTGFSYTSGFDYSAELCVAGHCSVQAPANSPLDLRLTNVSFTCNAPKCQGFGLEFFASGVVTGPFDYSLAMDDMHWNVKKPVFGLFQFGVTTVNGTFERDFAFDSSESSTAPTPIAMVTGNGPFTLSGLMEFVFPPGAVNETMGDTFSMPDSFTFKVTDLSTVTAPEPTSFLLVGGSLFLIILRNRRPRKRSFACLR